MTFTFNIVVVVSIPVSISLFTTFVEDITLSIALLLHIVAAMLEVTFNSELSHVVSFSFSKGCVALITSDILGSIGNNCLYWDDCCHNGLSVLNNVSFTWCVMILIGSIATPSVNSAVTVLSVLVLSAELVESLERVQATAIISVIG